MTFNFRLYQQVWQRLNQSKITTKPQNNLKLIPLQVCDRLTSTNTKLWELIDNSEINTPTALIALEQTAGKGQWGNKWVSSRGGLYLSLALDLDLSIDCSPHLVMATAWGIAKVLRYYQLPVTIKWSNDLILEKRKLGGIKIETRTHKNKLERAIIGVGINWCNPVPDPGINLQTYYQNKPAPVISSLEELAAITSYGVGLGYQYYLAIGIEKLLVNYLAILNSLGKQVTVGNSLGEVIGVTTSGKLQLKLQSPGATTEIALAPGEISLGY